jgi:hypothetical protein
LAPAARVGCRCQRRPRLMKNPLQESLSDRSQIVDSKDGEMSEWLKEHVCKTSSRYVAMSVGTSRCLSRVSQWREFRQEFEPHVGHDLRRPVQGLWPPTIAATFFSR